MRGFWEERGAARVATWVAAGVVAAWLLAAPTARALDDGLARTPPMGWSSWTADRCHVTEGDVERAARALATSGMRGLGYRYVNVDDCWMARTRARDGSLRADPRRFPHGIPRLVRDAHGLGLKLGLYLDAGTRTCAHFPGSLHHYGQDAATLARWQVDYVKIDWCGGQGRAQDRFTEFRAALARTRRRIVVSICSWGHGSPWAWGARAGHLWRIFRDVDDGWGSVLSIGDADARLAAHAGPGGWNDPDFLMVGNGGMTANEYRSQFSLWSVMAAPLITSTDLDSLGARDRQTVTNREVIAIDQDRLGAQGVRVGRSGAVDVWLKRLAGGDRALLLLNRGWARARVALPMAGLAPSGPPVRAHDLWNHSNHTIGAQLHTWLGGHGARLYRLHG